MSEPDVAGRQVAVLGAAGYVGQRLCAHLRAHGYAVTGVCRPYAAFLLERLGVAALDPALAGGRHRFPHVVNLAYPTRGPGYTRRAQNAEILDLVGRLLAPGGRLVQTSTLAVFGFGLDVPPFPGPVASRADHEYCVSKIAMEHELARRFGSGSLDLVRLGNIWGAGCPNWVVGLLDRLRSGQSVAVRGQAGWSNATEVGNVCDYLEFLLRRPSVDGVRYHHLAELAATPWSEFITLLAGELGVEPASVGSLPAEAEGRAAELHAALRRLDLNGLVRSMVGARRLGADVRAVFSRMPMSWVQRLKRVKGSATFPLEPLLTRDDRDFLTVVSCARQFSSVTDPAWRPPVSLAESFGQVRRWVREVGYV